MLCLGTCCDTEGERTGVATELSTTTMLWIDLAVVEWTKKKN